MRILHISDFHYLSKAKAEFDRVVEKMADSLKTQDKIDIIVFSGDLIHKDASVALFKEAADCLFTPVFEATGLDKTRLLLCPGNHDFFAIHVKLADKSIRIIALQHQFLTVLKLNDVSVFQIN